MHPMWPFQSIGQGLPKVPHASTWITKTLVFLLQPSSPRYSLLNSQSDIFPLLLASFRVRSWRTLLNLTTTIPPPRSAFNIFALTRAILYSAQSRGVKRDGSSRLGSLICRRLFHWKAGACDRLISDSIEAASRNLPPRFPDFDATDCNLSANTRRAILRALSKATKTHLNSSDPLGAAP